MSSLHGADVRRFRSEWRPSPLQPCCARSGRTSRKGWERSFAAVVTNVRSGPASITTPRGLRHRRPPIPALPYRVLRDPRRRYSAAARAQRGRRSWCRGKAVDAHEEEASPGGHTGIRRRGNARPSSPHSAQSSPLHATRRTGATNHLGPRVQNGNIRHEIPSQECAPST